MKNAVFLFLFFALKLHAGNIVVLTSLPPEDARTQAKLERIAHKKLNTLGEHELIIESKVDMVSLYNHLTDKDTIALIWLSHGAYTKTSADSPMAVSPKLLDFKMRDLAFIFKKIHPNIQFLGVVGCNSKQIFSETNLEQSGASIYLPKRKIIATWGLRRAIRKLKRVLKKNNAPALSQRPILAKGHRIDIERSTLGEAFAVYAGDHILGVMPKTLKRQSFYLPKGLTPKIVLKTGTSPFSSEDVFGDISIYSNSGEWKVFSKPDGTPFGVNERIFKLRDPLLEGDLEEYELFTN